MPELTYGSVCSGIEAASVAWKPLGWRAAWLSEIEPFPCSVLVHHYPDVPNMGDFTKIGDEHGGVDLVVGGTPCQDFSVAGKRAGFDGLRGSLTFAYVDLVRRIRPRWIVWENVPGIFGGDTRRGFAEFLGRLSDCGYSCCWRVLDAQYVRVDGLERAVPQRRRRVFVVGHLGDWRRAAAVLLEPESLRGNTAPRRETGQGVAGSIAASTRGGGGLGTDFDCDGGLVADVGCTLNAHYGSKWGLENQQVDQGCPLHVVTFAPVARTLSARYDGSPCDDRGPDVVAFDLAQITSKANRTRCEAGLPASTLSSHSQMHAATRSYVRRLTPRECERLQGFPDDYTLVPHRGKPAADGVRYKALGNSMAVNVMRWIGARINAVEELTCLT
jgi:DNA (cytosine-5)-methyltransferase 1